MQLESALTSILILFCLTLQCTEARTYEATLQMGQSIGTSDTMVSANGSFELGFFPKESSTKYYVGIKFKKIPDDKFVWVANRNYPFQSSSAILTIHKDGNLVIVMDEVMYYVSNISSSSSTYAMLLESGNFILVNVSNSRVLWQSFDYPTDTLLPGMNLGHDYIFGYTWSLRSWKTADNPAPGVFSLHVVAESTTRRTRIRQLTIKRKNEVYWTGDELSNFTFQSYRNKSHDDIWRGGYFTWLGEYGSRLVLEVSGELNEQLWSEEAKRWVSLQSSRCGTEGLCGKFSICNPKVENPCACLYGFRPSSESSWNQRDASAGCVRKTEFTCSNTTGSGMNYGFKQFSKVEFPPDGSLVFKTENASICEIACSSNCSCVAYAYGFDRDCFLWNNEDYEVYDLKNVSLDVEIDDRMPSFFLKLAASELHNNDLNTRNETEPSRKQESNRREVLIVVMLISFLVLFILGLSVYFYRKRKLGRKGEDLLRFDVGMSIKVETSELTEAEKVSKVNKREVKLPLFSLVSVSAATDNFSAENKLGEGGFGPVYKGKLLNGDEVAVKRLSKRSGQGWEELKNEALLIAKLQHKNLVRLLGCCIERDEKMLIYEFMPNKSLDFFLFDETKSKMLDWETRVKIIDGIVQGLLYLHQYSRFRIIHRDLKASNILLDINMSPKISDFGLARIFGGNELQANTNRIVGTYGYMSPEYALEGIFSIKSDVFSFGVLLLEIISGKKNTGLYHTNSLNLLGFAWDLWTSGRGMDLMDPVLKDVSIKDVAVLRYVNIALLCVQESPADRPTMSDIVSMVGNENAVLPSPKPHAFLNVRGTKNAISAGTSVETFSVNTVTTSVVEAR